MNLIGIAWRSMWQRRTSTTLTAISMALGVALVVSVLVMVGTIDDTFRRNTQGFDMIVGAKGSSLQLVLNTVYHLDKPIENLPYTFYLDLKENPRYQRYVQTAIPYCLGDNHQGYRVVGTTPELFTLTYGDDKHYKFASGRNMDEEGFFEAVVGSVAAANCDPPLQVGSKFRPTHGFTEDGVKHDEFTVVGVLAPTGTPNDRALFVNIEGFFLLEGHALPEGFRKSGPGSTAAASPADDGEAPAADPLEDTGEAANDNHGSAPAAVPESAKPSRQKLPIEQREVTAILIRTPPENPMANMVLPRNINKSDVVAAQAVLPTRVIFDLFDKIVGPLRTMLLFLTAMIVVVAGIGILVAILNSMNERKRDIAVMRALGAKRATVMIIVLLESMLLSVLGGVGGFLLGHGLIAAVNPIVVKYTGVSMGFTSVVMMEWTILPGLFVLAVLVGILPGMLAYRTDVSKALSAAP